MEPIVIPSYNPAPQVLTDADLNSRAINSANMNSNFPQYDQRKDDSEMKD